MDKILSYPLGFLEALPGRILLARAPTHRKGPVSGAYCWSLRARVIGPVHAVTGQAHHSGANSRGGPAIWPKFCRLEHFQELHRFPKIKLRRFSRK